MRKFLNLYSRTALIVLNTLVLFVLLNIVAHFLLLPPDYSHYITSSRQMLKKNPALMQKIHADKPIADIAELYATIPNLKSHPVLEFMTTPCSERFYHVGFENCRYNTFIHASNIKQYINQSTWVLGGSTTFGNGVADDETLPYFLHKLDSTTHYLNFGTAGFHQQLEIERLIVLLKKGYRPSRVLLLDGLNDLTQLTSGNFDPNETPARPYNAYAQDFCVENLGVNKNLGYALPVVKLWYRYMAGLKTKKEGLPACNLGDEKNLYHTQPFVHYQMTKIYEPAVDSALLSKVDTYYQSNLTLLDALSKAYGFEYAVFFQPQGPMLQRNHFIPDYHAFQKEFSRYRAIRAIYLHIKDGIRNNRFPRFYDLTAAHEPCAYPYVDLTHYSSSMNQLLAGQILSYRYIWTTGR